MGNAQPVTAVFCKPRSTWTRRRLLSLPVQEVAIVVVSAETALTITCSWTAQVTTSHPAESRLRNW